MLEFSFKYYNVRFIISPFLFVVFYIHDYKLITKFCSKHLLLYNKIISLPDSRIFAILDVQYLSKTIG